MLFQGKDCSWTSSKIPYWVVLLVVDTRWSLVLNKFRSFSTVVCSIRQVRCLNIGWLMKSILWFRGDITGFVFADWGEWDDILFVVYSPNKVQPPTNLNAFADSRWALHSNTMSLAMSCSSMHKYGAMLNLEGTKLNILMCNRNYDKRNLVETSSLYLRTKKPQQDLQVRSTRELISTTTVLEDIVKDFDSFCCLQQYVEIQYKILKYHVL